MYKECPSSSSSVQEVSKLVHRTCTDWALAWAHVYISKQFTSLGTLSVTAWTQLVHICEQVSYQVGHSNFYSSDSVQIWYLQTRVRPPIHLCREGTAEGRAQTLGEHLMQHCIWQRKIHPVRPLAFNQSGRSKPSEL